MTKQEFDKIGTEMGYGPCADYMWEEIERFYSSHDGIGKERAVYIYWNDPGLYRHVLDLRYKINDLAVRICPCDGYQFLDTLALVSKLADLKTKLDATVSVICRNYEEWKKGRKVR